jgi:hypothetical protein
MSRRRSGCFGHLRTARLVWQVRVMQPEQRRVPVIASINSAEPLLVSRSACRFLPSVGTYPSATPEIGTRRRSHAGARRIIVLTEAEQDDGLPVAASDSTVTIRPPATSTANTSMRRCIRR